MNPKLVVIEFSVILLLALFICQSNGNVNYETDSQPKIESSKTKRYSINNQPNHLFHFVQVSTSITILLRNSNLNTLHKFFINNI